MSFSQETIDSVWNKARTVDGYDPKLFRKDACGAWIIRDKYGVQDNIFGWEIDHIVPKTLLKIHNYSDEEIDFEKNLRAFQHQNNASKGDDYPSYTSMVTSEGSKNIIKERVLIVNKALREDLNQQFNLSL